MKRSRSLREIKAGLASGEMQFTTSYSDANDNEPTPTEKLAKLLKFAESLPENQRKEYISSINQIMKSSK